MKARLTFNLPDDQHEFDLAVQGSNMYSALWDISQELRTMWKYREYETEKEYALIDSIREKFYDILNSHNISLDK